MEGGGILFDYDVALQRYERNVISPQQVRSFCREVATLPSNPMVSWTKRAKRCVV